MNSEQLVYINLPTKKGINIYCSKIIDNLNFYKQTLKESGVELTISYDDDDVEIFNINDVLECMDVMNCEDIYYFNQIYGKEFNSSKYKLFDIIDEEYFKKYGCKIQDGPVFQKYNELFRKIKIIEKQTNIIWKDSREKYRIELTQYNIEKELEKCYNLLEEPYTTEREILNILETLITNYRNVKNKQDIEKMKEEERKKLKEEQELKKDLTITKNKFGQFVYEKYNLVYDPKMGIIGRSNLMGGYYPLDLDGVKLCEKLKLKYTIINNKNN